MKVKSNIKAGVRVSFTSNTSTTVEVTVRVQTQTNTSFALDTGDTDSA
jgi:hypothetical protein